jgi:tRNA(Ile)-lysidine synthase
VIAAVSGGSDSVAMLRLLHDLHGRGELQLETVAHLNHRIRADADDDEAFCAALAGELGVRFVSARIDVRRRAREHKQSLELAGRLARRAFLDDLRRTPAHRVATAHTRDDQAETVLLHLLRGAGQRGLSGIAPSRAGRIRPVLWATRAGLRRDLESRGQPWREDVTNADISIRRNRVRHELLPYLERHFNPSAIAALARLADAARADDLLLARHAVAASTAVIRSEGTEVRVDAAMFLELPEGIARRVAQHALSAAGHAFPNTGAVSAVLDVARGIRAAADLDGVRVEPFREFVVLVRKAGPRSPQPFRLVLTVPGEVPLPSGQRLKAEGPLVGAVARTPTASVAQIDASVGTELVVRSRQAGDRLRPVGLGGSKKVQDILVDRKVERVERDSVPIVTDPQGRIVWVAGHALSEEFRVTERTKAVIILKLRRL